MSVPEQYQPNRYCPWRVSWGFGAFRDFPTAEGAWFFYNGLPKNLAPVVPFNAMELWA